MKTTFIYRLVYRLILWASAQFFALSATLLLLGFVARLVFALAWRLFVGFMFILIIILLII